MRGRDNRLQLISLIDNYSVHWFHFYEFYILNTSGPHEPKRHVYVPYQWYSNHREKWYYIDSGKVCLNATIFRDSFCFAKHTDILPDISWDIGEDFHRNFFDGILQFSILLNSAFLFTTQTFIRTVKHFIKKIID